MKKSKRNGSMRERRGGHAVVLFAIASLWGCSSEGSSAPPAPDPTNDAGVPGTPVPAAPPQSSFNKIYPTGVLAFANGVPPRISVIELTAPAESSPVGQVTPLPTKAGPSEMPSFDTTGRKLLYVHTDGATRAIRQFDIGEANDALVVTCTASCEGPRFATDGSVWFVEHPAGAPLQVMRVAPGAAAATPWTVDLSGCTVRSFDLSFEGDRIVLSLDAASADPRCTTDKVGIVILPLAGAALPAPIKIADPQIASGSPISRATSWTEKGTVMFVATGRKYVEDEVFERDASGGIRFIDFGDAFTVMRDGARRGDGLVYYFARGRFDDGTRFISAQGGGLDYYLDIDPRAGNHAPYSPSLGLFSWGPAPIPERP